MFDALKKRYVTRRNSAYGCEPVRCFYLHTDLIPVFFEIVSLMTNEYIWEEGENGIPVRAQVNEMFYMLEDMKGLNNMIGAIVPLLTDSPPPNMVWCDGGRYHKDTFPELWEVIAPQFVDGDEIVFPNLETRFILGTNDLGMVNITGGEAEHALTEAEMPQHYHLYEPTVSPNVDLESPGAPDLVAAGIVPLIQSSTGTAGGNQPHNNMPPYIRLRFAIVVRRASC